VRAAVDSRQWCQEDQQDLQVCHGECRGLERAKGSLRVASRENRGFRKMHLEIVSSSLIGRYQDGHTRRGDAVRLAGHNNFLTICGWSCLD